MIAFWIATAYSVFTVAAPDSWQRHFLLAIRIDPNQRLAVWGFGLALFFFYAGFRAWSDAEENEKSDDIGTLRSELAELREAVGRKITKEQRRLFKQASKAVNLSGWSVSVFHSALSTEAQAYCYELIDLFRTVGIGSGGHGTPDWPDLDELDLAMIVGDPENPPEPARKAFNLLAASQIPCVWARDSRRYPLRPSDFWLYVGKKTD